MPLGSAFLSLDVREAAGKLEVDALVKRSVFEVIEPNRATGILFSAVNIFDN